MKKVGDPFKMLPLTRKAENAVSKACQYVQVQASELQWRGHRMDGDKLLVVAHGDLEWETARWIHYRNDPDWQIV